MLKIIFFSVINLIFPIFLNIDFGVRREYKRLFFRLKFFGFIPFIKGYIEIRGSEIFIFLGKKKVIIFPIKSVTGVKKKMKPLQEYHIYKANFITEFGLEDNLITSYEIAFLLNYFSSTVFNIITARKPYINLKSNFFIEENACLNLYAKFTVVFNLFMIILSIIKIIMEKLIYAIRKSKQSNKQSS